MSTPASSLSDQKKWRNESIQKHLKFDVFDLACSARAGMFEECNRPFLGSSVLADWSLPMQGVSEESMDLNQLCIQHPTATYYVRATGDAMCDAGIHDNDILVVDRSLQAVSGNIVVAALNGDFTVKVLSTTPQLSLEPRNSIYSTINIGDDDHFEIFGVVTYVVHSTLG